MLQPRNGALHCPGSIPSTSNSQYVLCRSINTSLKDHNCFYPTFVPLRNNIVTQHTRKSSRSILCRVSYTKNIPLLNKHVTKTISLAPEMEVTLTSIDEDELCHEEIIEPLDTPIHTAFDVPSPQDARMYYVSKRRQGNLGTNKQSRFNSLSLRRRVQRPSTSIIDEKKLPSFKEVVQAVRSSNAKLLRQAKVSSMNFAFLEMAAQGQVDLIFSLLNFMRKEQRMNDHTLACVFAALYNANRPRAAFDLCENLIKDGVDIGPIAASSLLKLCSLLSDLDLAVEVFSSLQQRGVLLNRYSYNCLLHMHSKAGQVDEIHAMMREMMATRDPELIPDSYSYAALLKAIAISERWHLFRRALADIEARPDIKFDAPACSALVSVASHCGKGMAAKCFDLLIRRGATPSSHLFNALLAAEAKYGDLEKVSDVYQHMIASGIRPDEYTFNALFVMSARAGASWAVVDSLLADMRRWGVRLNTILGASLINAYRRTPELVKQPMDPELSRLALERVEGVLKSLVDARLANNRVFGLTMVMQVQCGHPEEAFKLLACMKKNGPKPERDTYTALINACMDAGLEKAAEKLRKERLEVFGFRKG